MKSVRVQEPGTIEVVDLEIPTPSQNEALLKVRYAGICGSDMQTLAGTQPFASYPRVPGHEFVAEVVTSNGDSDRLPAGTLVVGNPYFNCGACYSCQRGLVNCCEHNETMGVHRDGAFQEYIVMPNERLHVADGLDPQIAAMVEPLSIGYHAMNRVRTHAGQAVAVLGAGAIGLLTALSAKSKGAQVYVADIVDERLNLAKSLGIAGTFNLRESTPEQMKDAATSSRGFDVVAEATGLPVSFLNAIELAAFGGSIALIGNGKREVSFNQSLLIKKELNVHGSRNSLGVFAELVEALRSGAIDPAPILTSVRPAAEAAEAMANLRDHPESNLKVLLEF